MPRNITAAMDTHLQQEVTTLAVCIEIIPDKSTLRAPMRLTEHDKDVFFGGETYSTRDAFNLSTIRTTKDFTNDNTEITLGNRVAADMEGLQNANVSVFYVNWQDTSALMGKADLFFGFVTAASLNEDTKELKLTVSGVGKRLSKKYLPKYSRTCRTTVGSTKCGVPLLPAFKGNTIAAYPRTFEIGAQIYDRPAPLNAVTGFAYNNWCAGNNCTTGCPATWTCTSPSFIRTVQPDSSTLTQTVARPVGFTDGDLLLFEVNSTAVGVSLIIESFDAAGDVTQYVTDTFTGVGKHNIATYVLPNSVAYRLSVVAPANTAITVTPDLFHVMAVDIPTTKKRLARITSKAARDRLLIPNGYFYKDALIINSTNFAALSDWSGTAGASGIFSVNNSEFSGKDLTLTQTVLLPPLSCAGLTGGCYFFNLTATITGGVVPVQVELLDENDVVLATHNSNSADFLFQMTNEPDKARITYTLANTGTFALSKVEAYIYNTTLSAPSDPVDVTLLTLAEEGTKNDIWVADATPYYFNTTVTSAVSPYEAQVFVEAGNIPLTAKIGAVTFLTGQNAGLRRTVRAFDHTTKQAELAKPLPFNITAGDKIIMTLGCDRHILTCGGVFNNSVNFRGEPYLPGAAKIGQILGI